MPVIPTPRCCLRYADPDYGSDDDDGDDDGMGGDEGGVHTILEDDSIHCFEGHQGRRCPRQQHPHVPLRSLLCVPCVCLVSSPTPG